MKIEDLQHPSTVQIGDTVIFIYDALIKQREISAALSHELEMNRLFTLLSKDDNTYEYYDHSNERAYKYGVDTIDARYMCFLTGRFRKETW